MPYGAASIVPMSAAILMIDRADSATLRRNPVMAAAQQVSQKALSLLDEFKAFALKGNVVDLAVGVIIGAAFGKIVDSLVKHIIMPIVGMLLPGEKGYLGWKLMIGATEIPYGLFLGECVNFLVVALALFICIKKFLGLLLATKQEEAPAGPPPLTKDQELLSEIRDLMKKSA
jgi:large conductance mechanosensitive channel